MSSKAFAIVLVLYASDRLFRTSAGWTHWMCARISTDVLSGVLFQTERYLALMSSKAFVNVLALYASLFPLELSQLRLSK